MHVSEVTDKIKALPLFDKLVLSEPSEFSQHGTITVEPRHFKDTSKNEIKLSGVHNLFVAHMYKDKPENEFFYLTFSHRGEQRDFRRHRFYPIEYNKIFVSGKTVNEIIKNLKSKLVGYPLK